MSTRRYLPLLLIALGFLAFGGIMLGIQQTTQSRPGAAGGLRDFANYDASAGSAAGRYSEFGDPRFSLFHDKANSYVISQPLGNETARALLGQSTWRLIHTTMARFPLHPTENEKGALNQFIFLLSRLYPCGDCAEHFQQLLHELPPRIDTRYEAEQWACEAHNKVNARLGKDILDCSTVHSLYDCGCKS
ncbi:hypothetical protein IWQ60_002346 [Tieghemiomyces parasiticus]|uniref:Sulfhydryl oxidase n=1 Tax=Tieghemiomyces parasiticus TaxID=78921 RepID=A0A9W8ABE7_9FUNG|nr:hypothetical protein IWQ60_002346 [Tieghemiomyces parasiticus]